MTVLRIQDLSVSVRKEVLAERTTIITDWMAMLTTGSIQGNIIFENTWFLQDKVSGVYFGKDSAEPAPSLNLPFIVALQHELPLPEPVSAITGQHIVAYIKSLHSTEVEKLLQAMAAVNPGNP